MRCPLLALEAAAVTENRKEQRGVVNESASGG
jgi:hypothetical protein